MNTVNLSLPYIAPAQAQKHVTHNEALRALDALVQLSVISRSQIDPPEVPADGARYAVPLSATGAWDGHAGALAAWQDGGWTFHTPRIGWRAWVADENALVVWTGETWEGLSGAGPFDLLGINTSADTTNRLALKADAALFSHDDITPGSGDMRVTLNKAGPAQTAALLYQSNFSGRAEIGLAGNQDLSIKVSADGADWKTALLGRSNPGTVSFPRNLKLSLNRQSADASYGINQRIAFNVSIDNRSGFEGSANAYFVPYGCQCTALLSVTVRDVTGGNQSRVNVMRKRAGVDTKILEAVVSNYTAQSQIGTAGLISLQAGDEIFALAEPLSGATQVRYWVVNLVLADAG